MEPKPVERRVVTAGFGDGYGNFVTIEADRQVSHIWIKTRDADGKTHSVSFLKHERDKVLKAMVEAFDACDTQKPPTWPGGR